MIKSRMIRLEVRVKNMAVKKKRKHAYNIVAEKSGEMREPEIPGRR
jgi:hypothetical protein